MIVADANLITYFWSAPRLWRSEFRNVLRKHLNAEHLSYSEALWFAQKAERDLRGAEHEV